MQNARSARNVRMTGLSGLSGGRLVERRECRGFVGLRWRLGGLLGGPFGGQLGYYALVVLGKFQVASEENFGAFDDVIGAQDFASLCRQLAQGVHGGPETIFESGQTADDLRGGRLCANYGVESNLAGSSFDLLGDGGLIHIIACGWSDRKHRHWFHGRGPAFRFGCMKGRNVFFLP